MRLPRWVRPISLVFATILAVPATTMVASAVETPLAGPAIIRANGLTVRVSDTFPQVLGYTYAGKTFGANEDAVTSVLIDGTERAVKEVSAFQKDGAQVDYTVRFEGTDVIMKATLLAENVTSQQEGTTGAVRPALTFTITELAGAHTVEIPDLGLASISSTSAGNEYATAVTSTTRDTKSSADSIGTLTNETAVGRTGSAYTFLSAEGVAVGLETNAAAYNANGKTPGTAGDFNGRWTNAVAAKDGATVMSVQPGQWTYRGTTATDAIGDDPRPYATVVFTGDANSDGAVNWQDGAIAYADVAEEIRGTEANHNWVITHIPFNFASQATHPFQRTADDVKRVSLATDGLGQRVMLKGYGAEGHDSAHVDYANNINNRAGGEDGLKTLLKATEDVNAIYGVHVNATEAYGESQDFGTLPFTGGRGWNWLGQSYYLNLHQDLGSGAIVKRFQDFRDEFPLEDYPNFRWIYLDVYYGSGWTADRLGHELNSMGWEVGSEWSEKFERYSTWSHWSNDENYGGYTLKGMSSQIIRFIDNAHKDTWNPNVVLGYPQIVDFEGWTGHQDQVAFYRNLWGNNLPAKFLQASRLMRQSSEAVDGGTRLTYTFANGTVGTGVTTVSRETAGNQVKTVTDADMAASRSLTYDGAEVLRGTSYLLPWTDNGTEAGAPRLYYYNPDGTESTWTLTNVYKDQASLALYRLTDAGKVKVADLPVSDGQVTIPASAYADVPAAERSATAFVLYPASTPSAVTEPHWGEGSFLTNPGFDGGLEGYTTSGEVVATTDAQRDPIARLGAGESSLSQQVTGLEAGTYQASAWVEVAGGTSTRPVQVSVSGNGVSPALSQQLGASQEASAEAPVTTVFENFENVTQGWGIFVKGNAGGSTDPRTVMAPLNAPWTQKGATMPDGNVKPTDDVIGGHWSLRSHEENNGLIYRTVPQTVDFTSGHRYRVSFDYENAYNGSYNWVTGYTRTGAQGSADYVVDRTVMPQRTTATRFESEFTAGACGSYYVGLERGNVGGAFDDFTIDNVRVEDLGEADDAPGCLLPSVSFVQPPQAGQAVTVNAVLTNNGDSEATNLAGSLSLPAGWSVQPVSASADTLAPGAQARMSWTVTAPQDSAGQTVRATLTVDYLVEGQERSVVGSAQAQVLRSVHPNGMTYLSDLPFSTVYQVSNGWGPIERDTSNGENQAGDGATMALRGTEYDKGLGAHAYSRVAFDLNGQCHTFAATVGVQDGKSGSVSFKVSAVTGVGTGTPQLSTLQETGVLTQQSDPVEVLGDVTGADAVLLEIFDGGNGNGSDHGNWANARVACGTGTINGPAGGQEPPATVDYEGPLTLVAAPAAYSANPTDLMFDGDAATFYDKNWLGSVAPHPSDIDLALLPSAEATSGDAQIVQGISVQPRAGQANGRIARYEVYAGQDAGNITTLVAKGTLPNQAAAQKIVFDKPVETKFLRLRVLSSYRTTETQPQGLLAIAELGLLAPDLSAPEPEAPEPEEGSQPEDGEGTQEPETGEADTPTQLGPVTVRTNAGPALGQDDAVATAVTGAGATGTVTTSITRSTARNYVAADQKHGSYFQRVPVTFTVPAAGTNVTLTVTAGEGENQVLVDDVRLAQITPAVNDLAGVDCSASPVPEQCTSRWANAKLAERLVAVSPQEIISEAVLQPGAFDPLRSGVRNTAGVGQRDAAEDEPAYDGELDKTVTKAGDKISIAGRDWRAGEQVTLLLDGTPVPLTGDEADEEGADCAAFADVPVMSQVAGEDGTVTFEWRVPEDLLGGPHLLSLRGGENSRIKDLRFLVVKPAGSLSATQAQPGAAVTVTGTGWKPGASVTLAVDGTVVEGAMAEADEDGSVTFQWTVPEETAAGAVTLTLSDGQTHVDLVLSVVDKPSEPGGSGEEPGGSGEEPGGSGEEPGGSGENPGSSGERPSDGGTEGSAPAKPVKRGGYSLAKTGVAGLGLLAVSLAVGSAGVVLTRRREA
ncbi:MAG: endo-alpha-N-acetylgalactosaminidase family protein [Actinomyces urogenitalis]|uniref:endo-alpha-N-acetylgalactosaminidase family protein n=1 Tax=Actinomyces urogenitalis TaxID=103621 RepID=UPI002A82711F|nr:endo-alpha-N-acetylgalactosaminidase family protein [Actinomyces urogenitalis]MDY3678081.1 endo-alpha-N-acetylgalactosaminidase family protein [Actinomyces urogenitalis]